MFVKWWRVKKGGVEAETGACKPSATDNKATRWIYPGMWHQLVGEPDENVELVFGEIVDWLLTRSKPSSG